MTGRGINQGKALWNHNSRIQELERRVAELEGMVAQLIKGTGDVRAYVLQLQLEDKD